MLILLLFWDYTTDSSPWILHITLVSWDDMDVAVHHRLTSNLSTVSSYVVTIWVELLIEYHLDDSNGYSNTTELNHIEVEERLHMTFRYKQHMTL